MMEITYIFEHKTTKYLKPNTQEYVPTILIVKTSRSTNIKGTLISISGKANPLPFKEAIITNSCVNIIKWIEMHDYKCISVNENVIKM